MMIEQIISWLYPAARPVTDWLLADDGNGPQIVHWNEQAIGAPQPTVEEVMAYEAQWRLDTAKHSKIAAIDARSEHLLTAGLEVAEGVHISTSLAAQQNLTQLLVAYQAGLPVLPRKVTTLEGGEYTIADANDLLRIGAIWDELSARVLDAGRALKMAVLAAESVEAVEAITDDRE